MSVGGREAPVEAKRHRFAVAALLLALAAQLAWGLWSDGLTIDELVYIGSGYRHLVASDYRMNPEQPPLSKLLGAVPLLALSPRSTAMPGKDAWGWSYGFIHRDNDPFAVVSAARVPNVLLTLGLATLLFRWLRSTHGRAAGLAALALAAFHPSLLAHGHLLTTDVPGALTMVVASWTFWRWSRAPGLFWSLAVALALGVAVSTRLTGWLLLPMFAILELTRWVRSREARVRPLLVLAACSAAVIPAVIWAAYGFHYAPWPGESVAQVPGPWLGRTGRVIAALQAARALPEAYLEGARFVAEHNAIGHPTYLLGRTSTTGWPHYYLVAFLVKNTPGFLIALVTAAALARRARERNLDPVELHWAVPAVVTFVAASAGRIQIGERYILPVYPYLILLLGSAAPLLFGRRPARALAAVVLLLHAGPAILSARAGHLTYFNLLAGGTRHAHRVLLDSNLDWGQDLPRLASWLERNGVERVQLGYHGSDDPDRFGIVHEDLPGFHMHPHRPAARPFEGTVAVSPNVLLGIFYPPGQNPYQHLLDRSPDDRAGVFFIYRLPRPGG
jgi:4-amino-4-deoxy-L-arabinose transferase-like glycosyltransferase